MENKKYYISTPIYYPSGNWHIGTCYTTVICDAIARFKRMDGYDTFYLTGTDEHGKKLQKKAEEASIDCKEFIDKEIYLLKDLWKILNISYDKFIRTTDEQHKQAVQKIFKKLYDKGDIYKSSYEGWYCIPCESFWTESQLKDGKCPDCGRVVERTKEESYFFKLSKYQDKIIELIEGNQEFLQPKSRQNEMLNNFLRPGLTDLAVSRTSFEWGIKVPFDEKHIIYVWIDALTNYITALGYMSEDTSLFEKFWPCDLHMVGKEIVRFHSIIWPALLMALDIPLPKKLYGHGWLLFGNEKISKSKGSSNIIDPFILTSRYGSDSLRYFLLREVPFGNDGEYSNYAFLNRINTDLCNDLGNLVSRSVSMIIQYFGGEIPKSNIKNDIDNELISIANNLLDNIRKDMDNLMVPDALANIFKFVIRANKYVDETTPWILNKTEEGKERLKTVMYNLAESIRIMAVALSPFIPETTEKIFASLGIINCELKTFKSIENFGKNIDGLKVAKGEHLFKRYDMNKELAEMDKIAKEIAEKKNIDVAINNTTTDKANNTEKNANIVTFNEITIDDFKKITLKVAKVVECVNVEKSDKLLKLTLEVGNERKTVASGIALYYKPNELIGKNVVLVYNLKPTKLRGILSEGMLLCADDDKGNVVLITTEKNIESGATVC